MILHSCSREVEFTVIVKVNVLVVSLSVCVPVQYSSVKSSYCRYDIVSVTHSRKYSALL